jgi:hypothetical protein
LGAGLKVGELVSYAGDSGREVAGLVVEIRRTDCRVLDPDSDRAFWLPQSHLRRGARSIRKGSAASLLSSLVLHLEGTELEIEKDPRGGTRAQIACAGLDGDAVDRVRRYFGAGFRNLRILPGGLGKVYLVVEFVTEV